MSRGLCKPNECNCGYSWSDCDLANLNNKSTTALLTKLRDEVEGECRKEQHSRMLSAKVKIDGELLTNFIAELCGVCKNFLALLEKAGE